MKAINRKYIDTRPTILDVVGDRVVAKIDGHIQVRVVEDLGVLCILKEQVRAQTLTMKEEAALRRAYPSLY